MCRSRRELSNAYLLAKIGVDTAENEPLEVWGENSIQYSLHSLDCALAAPSARQPQRAPKPRIRAAWRPEPSNCRAHAPRHGHLGPPNLKTIEKARSRLYRSRFSQANTHFSAFFEIYKICNPSHRSKFKIFAKIRQTFFEFLFEFLQKS